MPNLPADRPKVGLFVTCLVDLLRPSVGFAAVKLIEDGRLRRRGAARRRPAAASRPTIPATGRHTRHRRHTIAAFEGYDYVVAPSGSCAGMLKTHYPGLFAGRSAMGAARPRRFAAKVHELVSLPGRRARHDGGRRSARRRRVTYHDSCSGLRELGIKDAAAQAARRRQGLELVEMARRRCLLRLRRHLLRQISRHLQRHRRARRPRNIAATGAGTLLAGDLGCLMNMAGKLKRQGRADRRRHVAEVLAG